jgi:hypothetical protein
VTATETALRPLHALDERLVRPGSAHRLAIVRTGLAAAILVRLALRQWWLASRQPAALFDPMFAVGWLSQVPPVGVLIAVQVVGVAAAVAAIAGRRVSVTFPVAWVSYLLLAGLWSSAGKILHNDVLLLLASAPFLFAPGDARLGDRSRSTRWGWPVRTSLIIVGLVYFLAGFQKLHHSGLAWVTSDNLRWVLYTGARSDRCPAPGLARAIAGNAALCHAIAAVTLAIELSAPVVLYFRRSRPWFFVAVLLLHGGIWIALGLDYWAWIMCVGVVAVIGSTHLDREGGDLVVAGRLE